MGHVWIFQTVHNPNTNLKNNTKMGHWAQTKLLRWPFQFPDLNPVENEWGETEEKKY